MSEFNPNGWNSDAVLAKHFGVSRSTIWRWVKTGRLQQPVKIGSNVTRWYSDGRPAAA